MAREFQRHPVTPLLIFVVFLRFVGRASVVAQLVSRRAGICAGIGLRQKQFVTIQEAPQKFGRQLRLLRDGCHLVRLRLMLQPEREQVLDSPRQCVPV